MNAVHNFQGAFMKKQVPLCVFLAFTAVFSSVVYAQTVPFTKYVPVENAAQDTSGAQDLT